jgi:hypothetical protein
VRCAYGLWRLKLGGKRHRERLHNDVLNGPVWHFWSAEVDSEPRSNLRNAQTAAIKHFNAMIEREKLRKGKTKVFLKKKLIQTEEQRTPQLLELCIRVTPFTLNMF